ncbi:MAG: hypothetical protein QOF48_3297 [Verrucomicrobiota bacterium]|jgi:hypothetical protein
MGAPKDKKASSELEFGTVKCGQEAYKDTVKPMACEIGKSGQTMGRAVNAVLLPIKGLVWGVERLEQFLQEDVGRSQLTAALLEGRPSYQI